MIAALLAPDVMVVVVVVVVGTDNDDDDDGDVGTVGIESPDNDDCKSRNVAISIVSGFPPLLLLLL